MSGSTPGAEPMDPQRLAAEFERHRAHLVGVGYRITGSRTDAEDAVQEAWLRLSRLDPADVARLREPRAWLTTVVSRIGLDRLRSAVARRERYVGQWLPEPIVTALDGTDAPDPLEQVVRQDGVRMAALVVLDRLTPEQRVAFVLHDAFAVPFATIAEVLGCSVDAAKQHASRGRRALADADPPPRAPLAEQRRVAGEFAAALRRGDLDAVVRLLHPDVVMIGDGGGKVPAAGRPVVGQQAVANFLLGLIRVYGVNLVDLEPVLVNGDLGWLARPGQLTAKGTPMPPAASVIAIRDGAVAGIYNTVNPDKLTRLPDPVEPTGQPGQPGQSGG